MAGRDLKFLRDSKTRMSGETALRTYAGSGDSDIINYARTIAVETVTIPKTEYEELLEIKRKSLLSWEAIRKEVATKRCEELNKRHMADPVKVNEIRRKRYFIQRVLKMENTEDKMLQRRLQLEGGSQTLALTDH